MQCPNCQHVTSDTTVKCATCGRVYARSALDSLQNLEYLSAWLDENQDELATPGYRRLRQSDVGEFPICFPCRAGACRDGEDDALLFRPSTRLRRAQQKRLHVGLLLLSLPLLTVAVPVPIQVTRPERSRAIATLVLQSI